MKLTKKILAILLALLMAASANVVAFADEAANENENIGSTETSGEGETEPGTPEGGDETEEPEPEPKKETVTVNLKYNDGETKDVSFQLEFDKETDDNTKLAEIEKELKDRYPLAAEYEKSETYGKHEVKTYVWELEKDDAQDSAEPQDAADSEDTTENNEKEFNFLRTEQPSAEEDCDFNVISTAATCTEPAHGKIFCKLCGKVYSDAVIEEPLGHDWENGDCKRCDAKCEHDNDEAYETVNEKQATCTEKGYTGDKHYACGAVVQGEEIPELGHDWENGVCKRCDAKCEHDNDEVYETVNEKQATCTEKGYTGDKHYACGAVVQGEEIPELGHDWENGVCKRCDAKCEHDNDEAYETVNEKQATCTEKGYTGDKHYACGAVVPGEETPELGHDWENGVCTRCRASDGEPIRMSVEECSKTVYFIGEAWSSNVTVKLQFKNHSEIERISSENIVKNNMIKGFSTAKYNNNMQCVLTYVYNKKTLSVNIPIKCYPAQAVFEKINGNPASKIGVSYADKKSATAWGQMGNKGIQYKYQVSLRNKRFTLSPAAKKVVEFKAVDDANSLFSGTLTIKPIAGCFNVDNKSKDYYITVTGEANGETRTLKIYLYYVISSFKPVTKAETVTYGASKKPTVKFRETYVDGTYKDYSVTLSTKSVGKKSISKTVNGNTAAYYYYVKCKTPSVEVSPAKKAVNISWNKITGATGYKVYRATSKNGKYSCIKTIKSGKTLKYKNTKLKSKKRYYYKVVAVYSKNSKCNSSYSLVKSCKTK